MSEHDIRFDANLLRDYTRLLSVKRHTHTHSEPMANNTFDRVDYRPLWRQLENVAEMTGKTINRKRTEKAGQKKVMVNWAGYTEEEWVELRKAEAGEENKLDELQKDLFPFEEVKKYTPENMKLYSKIMNKCLF